MSGDREKLLTQTSKAFSYHLRHCPAEAGLLLDAEGWCDLKQLVGALRKSGKFAHLDAAFAREVVVHNTKQRFQLNDAGTQIRAVQGHSSPQVARTLPAVEPPAVLYHGTPERALAAILTEGLNPGTRHHVHLSESVETAAAVGARRGDSVVLVVDSLVLHRQGHAFHQAENGVWLTLAVPPGAISVISDPGA